MFVNSLWQYGDRDAAVSDKNEQVSYNDLLKKAELFSQHLGGGRKLLVLECQNDLDTLIQYVGCLLGGHVALLMAAERSDDVYLDIKSKYNPNYISRVQKGKRSLECSSRQRVELHPDLAILLPTSGSTGTNKYVRLSRQNIEANSASIAQYLDIDGEDRPVTTLPLQYSYGLSIVNSHLRQGATILLTNQTFFDRGFWDFAEAARATTFGGVPYQYEVLDKLGFHRLPLHHIRYLTQAGGRLHPDLVSKFAAAAAKRKIRFFVMYGQTEATARIAYLPPELLSEHPGSVGRPIPGGRLEILDEHGQAATKPGQKGELIYSGANVMMGYAVTARDLTSDAMPSRLATGDIGYFDNEGLYYICGRKSRLLKVFGMRIDLEELQLQLEKRGFRVVCGGEDNQLRVLTEKNHDLPALEVCLTEEMGISSRGVLLNSVAKFPRTPAGKIDYQSI